MATVHVTLSQIKARSIFGDPMPVVGDTPLGTETDTSSGTATGASTLTAGKHAFWSVTATGGNVWIKFAAAPVASAGNDHLILDGQTRDFSATEGFKFSVIDA